MTDSPWPAPLASSRLDARVEVPGSKSLTNRHLLLGAIAREPSTVRGALHSRDAALMVDALRALGVGVRTSEPVGGAWDVEITPAPLHGGQVDCGLAGTVMRFVPALAVLAEGQVSLDGDEGARRRPVAPIVEALRSLGAQVRAASDDEGAAVLPLTITGTGAFDGGQVQLDASGSSQFVSGLLLAAPAWEHGVQVHHTGGRVPSAPHIEMTLGVLRSRGVDAAVLSTGEGGEATAWQVAPGPVAGGTVDVEPDLSNAGVFLAAAMISGGTVRIPRLSRESLQPLADVSRIFTELGGTVQFEDTVRFEDAGRFGSGELVLHGPGIAGLRAVHADLSRIGELTPTIAALCTLTPGTSTLSGIAHLRRHETDRLAALTAEITRVGGVCRETPDGLEIEGRSFGELHGEVMETYHDHRMATFAALLGLVVPGIRVRDVATTAKTLPDFTARWASLLEER